METQRLIRRHWIQQRQSEEKQIQVSPSHRRDSLQQLSAFVSPDFELIKRWCPRLSGRFVPEGMWRDIRSPQKHSRLKTFSVLKRQVLHVSELFDLCSSSSRRFRTAGADLRSGWGWRGSTRCIRPCSVCCLWPRSEILHYTRYFRVHAWNKNCMSFLIIKSLNFDKFLMK